MMEMWIWKTSTTLKSISGSGTSFDKKTLCHKFGTFSQTVSRFTPCLRRHLCWSSSSFRRTCVVLRCLLMSASLLTSLWTSWSSLHTRKKVRWEPTKWNTSKDCFWSTVLQHCQALLLVRLMASMHLSLQDLSIGADFSIRLTCWLKRFSCNGLVLQGKRSQKMWTLSNSI